MQASTSSTQFYDKITKKKLKTFSDLTKKPRNQGQSKEVILKADRKLFGQMILVAESRKLHMSGSPIFEDQQDGWQTGSPIFEDQQDGWQTGSPIFEDQQDGWQTGSPIFEDQQDGWQTGSQNIHDQQRNS